ncbi:hypothetical protein KCP76_20985 [Salmonella enterica subsp. enterica serovar Weltevreden]|nr:hypothetical protein KCP76_20985 [Salmonella enterica subsp. enterica serovar Weltevreden]
MRVINEVLRRSLANAVPCRLYMTAVLANWQSAIRIWRNAVEYPALLLFMK